jgi:16S rRNA (cytosine967-C5)-methyltransferase
VGRRLWEALSSQPEPGRFAPPHAIAEYYSHPEWLVRRWLAEFGADATRRLLVWNQTPGALFLRWRPGSEPVPAWLIPTVWPAFYEAPPGRHAEVEAAVREGLAYIQDPGTRLAVERLAPLPGETVLDLCAAPGGKSVLIADTMGSGRVLALDLPGDRLGRLKENLGRIRDVEAALVPGDVARGAAGNLEARGFPTAYSAVLIDVPCSNTGVMRHRVDVKWRLLESDLARHGRQQGALLAAASRLVAPGGRLVYSTCSIDQAENEKVVADFLERAPGFALEEGSVALPWEARHDGGGAYRLRNVGPVAAQDSVRGPD